MRIRLMSLVVLFTAIASLPAYNPPPGGEEWHELVSPAFLGMGLDLTDTDAIMGDAVNPALSARRERTAAGLYYGSLIGPQSAGDNRFGHIVAADFDYPSRFGVLGASALFMDARLRNMDLGVLGRARATYARELFPGWLIGAAGSLTVGTQDKLGLGIAADIGLTHLPGRLLFLDDVRWAATLTTVGAAYRPHEEDGDGDRITGFPSLLTPSVGASVSPWSNDRLAVRLAAFATFPRVQNVRAGGRIEVGIDEIVTVGIGGRYDLHQQSSVDAADRRSLLPSLGVTVDVGRILARRRGEAPPDGGTVRAALSVAPLTGSVVAIGTAVDVPFGGIDREPPQIAIDTPETVYVSPNNDGAADDIVLPITIDDRNPIESYELVIEDEDGTVIRRIENKDPRPELRFDALVQEIREGETGIEVPESIRWDGRTDQGGLAPDGAYRYRVRSSDILGNVTTSPARTVVIDTTPPDIEVERPESMIFSPNDDGNLDELVLAQRGSAEEQISARILAADGSVVRTFDFEEPQTITWDGTDDSGALVPDGVYRYEIVSTDLARNRSEREVSGIILNRETQSVFVTALADIFDSEIGFALVFPETDGLESWQLSIETPEGEVQRTYTGETPPDEPVVWGGRGPDGERSDGLYVARLSATYANGGRPGASSREVRLDSTAPRVSLELAPQPFSPDNDGFEDELEIAIDVEEAGRVADWSLVIDDPRGGVFREFSGTGMPAPTLIWDGTADDGTLVEAAEDYPWRFTIVDSLGHETTRSGAIPIDVLVIREDGRLKIRISNIVFAPNSPAFPSDDQAVLDKNFSIINRIAEILERYDQYQVIIEGHAVNLSGTEREQVEELVPLSRARAETVRAELVERGLDPDRFEAVGVGGTRPLVPHTDVEERWRNRRVEFVLVR